MNAITRGWQWDRERNCYYRILSVLYRAMIREVEHGWRVTLVHRETNAATDLDREFVTFTAAVQAAVKYDYDACEGIRRYVAELNREPT